MRTLRILCGIAILLTTLHLGHAVYHYYVGTAAEGAHDPVFWAGIATASLVGMFSLIGAGLLLFRR